MSKIEHIDNVAAKIESLIPDSLKEADFSIRQRIKSILESFAAELNLASREEFDVQAKVLLKTRQKLEDLEKKVAALGAADVK